MVMVGCVCTSDFENHLDFMEIDNVKSDFLYI